MVSIRVNLVVRHKFQFQVITTIWHTPVVLESCDCRFASHS